MSPRPGQGKGVYRQMTPSYRTAHMRPTLSWGAASKHACVRCSSPAAEWAYDHTDEAELSEVRADQKGTPRTVTYSAWPEFYKPMCRPCHVALDATGRVSR